MQYVDTALLVLCLSGLLGLRVWAFGQFQELRDKMNQHENKADVHVSEGQFVKKELCALQVTMLTDNVSAVKQSVDKLETTFKEGMTELKQMVSDRQQHGTH